MKTQGGGVLAYIKGKIPVAKLSHLKSNDVEFIWVLVGTIICLANFHIFRLLLFIIHLTHAILLPPITLSQA